MVERHKKKAAGSAGNPSVLFGLVSLLIVLGLAAGVASLMTGNLNVSSSVAGAGVQETPPLDPANARAAERRLNRQRVIGARVSSMLPELKLPRERLAEFSTMEEVSRAMPTKFYPSRERIRTAQHGLYEAAAQKLEHIAGEPLTDEVKPYADLSRREKLLLFSDWAGTDYIDQPVYVALMARMNIADLSFVPDYYAYASLWTEADLEKLSAIHNSAAGDRARTLELLAEEWMPQFVSPVAQTIFEPWHAEWAAGHGYIVEISDQEERQRLVEAVVSTQIEMSSARISPSETDRMLKGEGAPRPSPKESSYDYARFYYYRLYGEHEGSIIAEGIYQMDSYEWVQRRWYHD